MDLPEVGGEFSSCWWSARAILIGILQNRQEMQFSAKDRLTMGSYGEEVGRQGHPPNFVRPSIEGEQKFWGWISQRWLPSSAVAGNDGRANVLRKRKTGWKCRGFYHCKRNFHVVAVCERTPSESDSRRFRIELRSRLSSAFQSFIHNAA